MAIGAADQPKVHVEVEVVSAGGSKAAPLRLAKGSDDDRSGSRKRRGFPGRGGAVFAVDCNNHESQKDGGCRCRVDLYTGIRIATIAGRRAEPRRVWILP